MNRRIRPERFLAAALAAAMLAGCAPMRIDSYLERGADVRRYRTYSWGEADVQATGDPRLDNNRFFSERVQRAVEAGLAAKGFEKVTTGSADAVLRYHARVNQRVQRSDSDRQYGRCEDADCGPFVYDAGTLLIDVIDPWTQRVVWRGWAETTFDGVIDNQDWMEQRIDEAVRKILARLPPRTS